MRTTSVIFVFALCMFCSVGFTNATNNYDEPQCYTHEDCEPDAYCNSDSECVKFDEGGYEPEC